MAAPAQTKAPAAPPTLIGWMGLRFTLPPEWSMTGFSLDRANGYLKVDSPGSMFVQAKWMDPAAERPTSGYAWVRLYAERAMWRLRGPSPTKKEPKKSDLRPILESFLRQTGKAARKSKAGFDYKIKPETTEANGERTAIHFSWTGGGAGQGKIWQCHHCGRVVVAQVVGQPKDPIASVAAQMFGSMSDHGDDGWETWGLYDLVAGVPADFELKRHKLMSGYLKLDFERRGGERLVLERWGLASVARKKFTVAEWFQRTCNTRDQAIEESETTVQGHVAAAVTGHIKGPVAWARALRDAAGTFRPATRYDGCCWECDETNKLYAIQVWHNVRTENLLEEAAARCECH